MSRKHQRCCVKDCVGEKRKFRSIEDTREIKFYCIPGVISGQGTQTEELSTERRKQWIIKLRLSDFDLASKSKLKVCSRHFYSGQPAKLYDKTNPDWLPSFDDINSQSNSQYLSDTSTFQTPAKVARYERRIKRSRLHFSTPKRGTSTVSHQPEATSTPLDNFSRSVAFEENLSSINKYDSHKSESDIIARTSQNINKDETDFCECMEVIDTDISGLTELSEPELGATGIDFCGQTESVGVDFCEQTEFVGVDFCGQTDSVGVDFWGQTESVGVDICCQIEPNTTDFCGQTILRVCPKFEAEALEFKIKEYKELVEALTTQLKDVNDMIRSSDEEIRKLTCDIEKRDEKIEKLQLSQSFFQGDKDKVLFFTGLESSDQLNDILEEMEPYLFKNCKLSSFQQLILTLMKLRLASTNKELAYRFSISESSVGRFFYNTLNALYNRLFKFVKWPEREELQATMPMCFREKFGKKCSVIIDCFEVFSDKPSSVKSRAETWSNYKHHNTVKFLIGITPQGSISFLSHGWGGRVSDKFLTERSGLLEKLLPGDLILADRGFDIDDSVGLYCASIKYPTFVNGKKQLDPYDVEATRKLANVRIHVERVIGQLRQKYTILHSKIPVEFLKRAPGESAATIDKIARVCCALTNLTPSVVSIE